MITERSPLPEHFRFTLLPSDAALNSELVLTNAPDGWQGMASTWARDEKYHGVYRTIETQLRFIREGAAWLRKEYELHGVGAMSLLRIEELNYETLQYFVNFLGEFNFTQVKDGRNVAGGEDYMDIAVTEIGIINLLRAREKNIQEIRMHILPGETSATLSNVQISESANAQMSATLFFGGEILGSIRRLPGATTVRSINEASIVTIQERDTSWPSHEVRLVLSEKTGKSTIAVSGNVLSPLVDGRYVFARYIPKGSGIQHKYQVSVFMGIDASQSELINIIGQHIQLTVQLVRGKLIGGDDTLPDDEIIDVAQRLYGGSHGGNSFQMMSVRFEKEITFESGVPQDLALKFILQDNRVPSIGAGLPLKITISSESNISISGFSEPLIIQGFSFRAISLRNLFAELTNGITGNDLGVAPIVEVSDEVATFFDETFVTSGDAIRGIDGAMLKTTFQDFFNSVFAVFSISLTTPNYCTLRIEAHREAYRHNRMIIDLGAVKNLKTEPAVNRMYNQITVGSANKEYQTANGRFEYNTEFTYHLPLRRISSEGKFIPKYRTDSFGVTDIRFQYELKPSSDGRSDNDVFMIDTERGNDPLNREPRRGVPITNLVFGDSIQTQRKGSFNLLFSPMRCLRRHGQILASILFRQPDKTVTFASAEKTDANLTSFVRVLDGSDVIVERSSMDVSNYNPLWLPEIYEIETTLPYNLIEAMDNTAASGGYIQFTFDGMLYKGFPLEIRQEHWANPQQTIKLLAAGLPSAAKTINIGVQRGRINSGIAGAASFTISTGNIANGQAGTIQWFSDVSGNTSINAPTGFSVEVTNLYNSEASIYIDTTTGASQGVYYFRITIDDTQSAVAAVTILAPPQIETSPISLSFGHEGGAGFFNINSIGGRWYIKGGLGVNLVEFDLPSGMGKAIKISESEMQVLINANESIAPRGSNIAIVHESGAIERIVGVAQDRAPALLITPNNIILPFEGGEVTVSITSQGGSWRIAGRPGFSVDENTDVIFDSAGGQSRTASKISETELIIFVPQLNFIYGNDRQMQIPIEHDASGIFYISITQKMPEATELTITPDTLIFSYEGGTQTADVLSLGGSWRFLGKPNFETGQQTSIGEPEPFGIATKTSETLLIITANANSRDNVRAANFLLEHLSGMRRNVTAILEAPPPFITVTPPSLEFYAEGGTVIVQVASTGGSWRIEGNNGGFSVAENQNLILTGGSYLGWASKISETELSIQVANGPPSNHNLVLIHENGFQLWYQITRSATSTPPILDAVPSALHFTHEGGTHEIQVTSNVGIWRIKGQPDGATNGGIYADDGVMAGGWTKDNDLLSVTMFQHISVNGLTSSLVLEHQSGIEFTVEIHVAASPQPSLILTPGFVGFLWNIEDFMPRTKTTTIAVSAIGGRWRFPNAVSFEVSTNANHSLRASDERIVGKAEKISETELMVTVWNYAHGLHDETIPLTIIHENNTTQATANIFIGASPNIQFFPDVLTVTHEGGNETVQVTSVGGGWRFLDAADFSIEANTNVRVFDYDTDETWALLSKISEMQIAASIMPNASNAVRNFWVFIRHETGFNVSLQVAQNGAPPSMVVPADAENNVIADREGNLIGIKI